jgi:hypothetical protein
MKHVVMDLRWCMVRVRCMGRAICTGRGTCTRRGNLMGRGNYCMGGGNGRERWKHQA